jgi:hypothetical protein
MRRLTRLQYTNSVNDLLGVSISAGSDLLEDEKVGLFDSNLLAKVTDLHIERLMHAAEAGAEAAIANLDTLLACDRVILGEEHCAAALVDTLGPKAFRRPFTAQERADYLGLYTEARMQGESFEDGVRQTLRALLQSPQFIYIVENAPAGAPATPVSGYEAATRLSYFLWNSLPDTALALAAEAGQLQTAEAMMTEARRMLESERVAATLESFHRQWLLLDRLTRGKKDTVAFPEYTPELEQAMLQETADFAHAVIAKGDGSLASLFTSSLSPAKGPLLALYGAAGQPNASGLVELDPAQRAGLLTQASVLGAHAHFREISPVLTGAFVRANIMCQTPPPPPPNMVPEIPPAQPGETTRERFDRHRTDAGCATCHQLMDPIGYGFANYDAVGRFRELEAGVPIDASGQVSGSWDLDGPFNGPIELSQRLASSEQVRACVLGNWLTFALGRNLDAEADGCSALRVQEAFAESGYNVRQLLIAVAGSDAMRLRGTGGAQ